MIEALESRRLFAFTFNMNGGDLLVTGTSGTDKMVAREDNGTVTIRDAATGVTNTFAGVTRLGLSTNAGDDQIFFTGNSIRCVIGAGDGNDSIVVDDNGTGSTWADGMVGNDSVTALHTTHTTLIGSGGDDQIEVQSQATGESFIFGADGNDTITVRAGTNHVNGGNGNDTVYEFGGANDYSQIEAIEP